MQEGLERMKKLALLSRTRFRFANVHEQAVAPPLRRRRLWTTSACTTLCAGCPTSANHAPIGLPDRRNAPPSLPHHYVGFPNKERQGHATRSTTAYTRRLGVIRFRNTPRGLLGTPPPP
ncbi:hypothetical protein Mapa_015692 [Marchantia paleacea]|nr:hypothetical protein Mapa_015692 [Marchantia paleacea]